MENGASYVVMVLVQLAYGGSNILMKIALEKGLDQLVFIVYRHLIALLLLGPFAFVLERKHIFVYKVEKLCQVPGPQMKRAGY